jgi:hypothetical protein
MLKNNAAYLLWAFILQGYTDYTDVENVHTPTILGGCLHTDLLEQHLFKLNQSFTQYTDRQNCTHTHQEQ